MNRWIKILLIMPDAQMHKLRIFSHVRSAREAPVTLSTLAGMTSDLPNVEYQLVDESVDPVPLDAKVDLVGISVMTGTAKRAYALADHFRSKSIPVVLGGIHVTLMPEEGRGFADSLVVGMAERTWPQLVRDFLDGKMKPEYRQPLETEMSDWCTNIPTPRWDLHRKSGYVMPYTVHATRGCIHRCDFCTVPGVWKRFQRRPVEDVIRDIKAVPGKRFCLNDVSPFEDLEYAKELLTAMIPLKKKWGGLASTKITQDPELFDLLRRAGCMGLLIGFESVNQQTLNGIYKGFNKAVDYKELMRQLHGAGILVQGCFVFGFDEDGPDVFARTVDWVQELKVDLPRYSMYTPYPGSMLFARLQKEGRIVSYNWSEYDTMHVVIRPKQMSAAELYEGFRWAYKETFKLGRILRRTMRAGSIPMFPIAFLGNLTYRIFVKRLYASRGAEYSIPAPAQQLGVGQMMPKTSDAQTILPLPYGDFHQPDQYLESPIRPHSLH